MYKKLLIISLLLLFISATKILICAVIGVTDGDTINVLTSDNKPIKVRLYGIDCPEKNQAFGTKAKQFTSELCLKNTVEVKKVDIDRYGRIVGEIFLSDGKSLNRELVRNGFAWWYKKYAPNDTVLEQLEKEAKENKRGLWSDDNPTPPWEFRRGKKAKKVKPITPVNSSDVVTFNTTSKIYHCPKCRHALKCTKSCVDISKDKAITRGGKACKVCGGGCK